jgi:signal recognition particle subunit SRP54
MFESLQESLTQIFDRLRGRGMVTPEVLDETLREIRRALLSADVNFKVARDIVEQVREKARGRKVLESLTPAQEVIRVVRDELIEALGGEAFEPDYASFERPVKVLLMGLQGSGKTTSAARLAFYLTHEKGFRRAGVVALDLERPAAVEQLSLLATQAGCEFFGPVNGDVLETARAALADPRGCDVLVFDTQGRLHVDDEMMEALASVATLVKPHVSFLVVDAMTGQEAVSIARLFDERCGFDAVILTKLDGDARGGAALSVRGVTGKPIAYAGIGEKLDALAVFHPDRMAGRILGLGDVLSLIEKAEKEVDARQAEEAQRRMLSGEFTLDDFLDQLRQMKKLGGFGEILSALPKEVTRSLGGAVPDERELKRTEAIILSMTIEERQNPSIIDGSRKARIARGSGTTVSDVNRLIQSYAQAKKLMKQLKKAPKKRFPLQFPFGR